MSVLTIADLLARSRVDRNSHCWHWLGAFGTGTPRIWTLDHARLEKCSMSGPRAVWNIAHGEAPLPGHFVMRSCASPDCVAPVHHRQVPNRQAMGDHIRLSGRRKGKNLDACRQNAAKAHAARGIVPTPVHIVQAILDAGDGPTNLELAARFRVAHTTVSNIRLGKTRVHALALNAGEAA